MTAVVLMVKNEAARIACTINSCDERYVRGIIVYDTGSTDDTLDIITRTSKVPVHIKRGEFVNFEVSRNECLAFANECAREYGYDYFFLLDANDELIFDEGFRYPEEPTEDLAEDLADKLTEYITTNQCEPEIQSESCKGTQCRPECEVDLEPEIRRESCKGTQCRLEYRESEERESEERECAAESGSRLDFKPDTPISASWMVECYWNINDSSDYMSFKNTKFIRAKLDDLRWVGVVHEYLDTGTYTRRGLLPGVRVFQDRVKDNDGKSKDRWSRDRLLLEAEHERDPSNGRTVFYLAQTYSCLGENQMAYDHYVKRAAMGGFMEEKYMATFRCGEHAVSLKMDDYVAITWFLKSIALSDGKRAEPYVALSKIFMRQKQYGISYMFVKLACEVEFPHSALLFVDRDCYTYGRWHQLGIAGWYAGEYDEGKRGCMEAIKVKNNNIDKFNLQFYVQHPLDEEHIE